MNQEAKSNPLGLPDNGIYKLEKSSYGTAYTLDGRECHVESDDGLVFSAELAFSGESIELSKEQISFVPNNLVFEYFLKGLELIKVVDENGNWSTDERIQYAIENYDGEEFNSEDHYDHIVICKHSGAYFEYDSIKQTYCCVVGNQSVSTDSFRDAATMPFAWAVHECDLLKPSGSFLEEVMETLFLDGSDKAIQLLSQDPRLLCNDSPILKKLASMHKGKKLSQAIIMDAINSINFESQDLKLITCELSDTVIERECFTSNHATFKCKSTDSEQLDEFSVEFFFNTETFALDIDVDRNMLDETVINNLELFIKLRLFN